MQTDFDKIAEEYNQKVTLINSLDNWVFLKNIPKNRRCVLDIGCGTGELLSKLSLEQLLTVINFNKKETLLNMINNSMTKTDLQTILFQSTINDEQLLKYLQDKNFKKLSILENKKPDDIVENQP